MTLAQRMITLAMVFFGTVLTRFLPFLVFPVNKPTPPAIRYLSRVLPYAVMGLLVVYCLKGVTPFVYPYGLPEVIGVLCVALLHLWKRNMILSIGMGTVLYMVLLQVIFQ